MPLWASRPDLISNRSAGANTWRCTECHGWDYRGVAGAYGTGSKRTGVAGIMGSTKTDAQLTELIKNNHGYGAAVSDEDIGNLVKFVRNGLIDTTLIISNGFYKPDVVRGSELYQMGIGANYGCSICHGPDGLAKPVGFLTFKDYVGLKTTTNPWEFQHKVRFGARGNPGTHMPATMEGGESLRDLADLMAYTRTLPKALTATVARGGALYDKWWAVTGSNAPTGNMPLWASRPDLISNRSTGANTWRCIQCHGFDYRGVEGAYSTGSKRTGVAGIYGTTKSEAELTELIKVEHGYGAVMNAMDIQSLVLFVQNGMIDTTTILQNGVFIGDSVRGQALYDNGIGSNLSCAICHGADGLAVPRGLAVFVDYPGYKAATNPWEYQHKIRYGHPGTAMPGSVPAGGSVQDAADVAAYTQSLPVAPPAPSPAPAPAPGP
jgi:thiosulfate dehydrogenase